MILSFILDVAKSAKCSYGGTQKSRNPDSRNPTVSSLQSGPSVLSHGLPLSPDSGAGLSLGDPRPLSLLWIPKASSRAPVALLLFPAELSRKLSVPIVFNSSPVIF